MKSRRRHELKENVLSHKLSEAVGFFRRYGTRLAWGALIVAIVALVAVYAINRRKQKRAELWAEYYSLISSIEKNEDWFVRARNLAEQDSEDRVAALACVALGDTYSAAAAGLMDDVPLGQPPAGLAEEYYRRVLQQFSERRVAVGSARLGLARLAETKGDFEAARREYDAILGMGELAGQPVVVLAGSGRKRLERLQTPVIMATRKPTTQPASRPATQPGESPAGPATRPVQ